MRIEVIAAYLMGVGLPLLEVMRRRTNFETIAGYVDDFIVGALLLVSAWAVTKGWPKGPVLLVAAWAILCGGLYGSFFGQFENEMAQDISSLSNMTVVVIKGCLYVIAIACLVLSITSAASKVSRIDISA